MSPRGAACPRTRNSFPRVSGYEPFTYWAVITHRTFSLRERG